MIYLMKAITLRMACYNAKGERTPMEKHLGRGSQRFQLSPGCTAEFQDHIVYSDLSIKMKEEVMHFE